MITTYTNGPVITSAPRNLLYLFLWLAAAGADHITAHHPSLHRSLRRDRHTMRALSQDDAGR